MYCPHTVLVSGGRVYICRHERADYYQRTPWSEVLNPLRYHVSIGKGPGEYRWAFNRDAWMWMAWSNFWFRMRSRIQRTR